MRIDLNADLGEGYANDAALLELVSSANVACGWHAGDETTMMTTIRAALARGVAVGAHPSYPDRDGFGRRDIDRTPDEIREDVLAQLRTIGAVARQCGASLRHVKPHGALYNRAARDRKVADAVVKAVAAFDPELCVVGLAGGLQGVAARAAGLRALDEVFPERGYAADGTLIPRGSPGAIVEDPQAAAAAAVSFAQRGFGQTMCIHGDNPLAVQTASAVRRALLGAGVEIRCVDV